MDNGYEIEVFYDGGCPFCLREVNLLKHWDRQNNIRFTDIDNLEFQAESVGKSYEELMARMHGRLPNGTWVQGVEVFRRMYSAVGYKKLSALSRLPIVSHLLNLGYALFARNRLRLTGRCNAHNCSIKRDAA